MLLRGTYLFICLQILQEDNFSPKIITCTEIFFTAHGLTRWVKHLQHEKLIKADVHLQLIKL